MMLWHRKVYGLGFAKTVERATELAIANLELKLRGRYPLDLKELGL